jgi:P27 family predicted phage terminase small subunit
MTDEQPTAPEHLSDESQRFYNSTVGYFHLEPDELKLLLAGCETWDRYQEARRVLQEEGTVVLDRFGQKKTHPAVAIERDSRIQFLRIIKALGLSDPYHPGRPTGQ